MDCANDASVGVEWRSSRAPQVDIYNYFPMLNNLVFAWLAVAKLQSSSPLAEAPPPGQELLWFPEAGFARILRGRYAAYVGTAKGGVIKVFDRTRGTVLFRDSGYLGETGRGRGCSTQYQDAKRQVRVSASHIEVDGSLATFSRPTMYSAALSGLPTLLLTIGRVASVGRWLKRQLVNVLIYRRRSLQVSFRRSIDFRMTGSSSPMISRGPTVPRCAIFGRVRSSPRFIWDPRGISSTARWTQCHRLPPAPWSSIPGGFRPGCK